MLTQNDKISVVVPVYNEIAGVKSFHEALLDVLKANTRPYEIIYIDDNSADGTFEWLNSVANSSTVIVHKKVGKKGKAFSLVEGFNKATGDIFVMIDGDLQYPPAAINDMLEKLEKADVVIANRKNYQDTLSRKVLSKGFRTYFGKFLFGLTTDIQSGLKMFTREVYETIKFSPSSPWTFDLEFLQRAKGAGFTLVNSNITFSSREFGKSHVNMIRTIFEIGTGALLLKLKPISHYPIAPNDTTSMVGAGLRYNKHKYITHTTLPFALSAAKVFTAPQLLFILAIAIPVILGFVTNPLLSAQVLVSVLSILYFIDAVFGFHVIYQSLSKKGEIQVSDAELKALDSKDLPTYTILCPLYKEAHIVPQFVAAIRKMQWPREKLDVMLLLEEDDKETIATIRKMKLPGFVRIVVVPDSQPKTKPKACNYGLGFAQGEYLVIFDAEDVPDPLQLKKAYIGFQKSPANVQCLQAKLNYYNAQQNMMTRFFAAEYSLWFDLTLTGIQSLDSIIPLGGTSNHFRVSKLRELQGWDPFNVTEDADLGIRLFQHGYKTAIIDSTTLEEATSRQKSWLKQRSRWTKGYMQTYLVHTRNIFAFTKRNGLKHSLIFQLTMGGKLLFMLLNPLLWIITFLYFAAYPIVGGLMEAIYQPPVSYIAVTSWIFGNFLFFYYYMIGVGKRGQWDLMKYVFAIPYYWALMSIASFISFYQLLFKPHYWEKTTHGLHLQKKITTSKANESATYEKLVPAFAGANIEGNVLTAAMMTRSVQQPIKRQQIGMSKTTILFNNIKSFFFLFRSPNSGKAWKEKRLKILIFNWRDTKHVYGGGAEVYVQELAKRWALEGNKVTIFAGNDGKNSSHEMIDGIEIYRHGGTYTVYFFAFIYYMFKFANKYDVVIDSENGIPFFTPLYVRKPVILLVHHVHQEIFRIFLHFPFNNIAAFLEGKLMPLLYQNKMLVTVSESSRREIIKLGFAKPENIGIISNGIADSARVLSRKTEHPSFIYVGRLKEYKNIDVAIKAFARVLINYPEAKFSIVGSGESYPKLVNLAKRLHIDNAVRFYGKVSEQEKIRLFGESWVAIQPSRIEGWGITVIEANAAGTPVIGSHVNGLQDSIIDNKTGLLVEAGNVDKFSHAMKLLIQDQDLREHLSQEAFRWAGNFSWDKSANEFYSLIGKSLSLQSLLSSYGKLALSATKNNYEG